MSILPPKAQDSDTSPTYSGTSQNPNPKHGSPSSSSIRFGSLSRSPDLLPPTVLPPVELAADFGNSAGPSEEVTHSNISVDQEIVTLQNTGRCFPSGSGNRQGKSRDGRATAFSREQQNTLQSDSTGKSPQSHSVGKRAHMKSGNHLLNFQYDTANRIQTRASPPPPRRPCKRKPYNKDLFLQANFKFIVLDTGNYAPESMDPDKMLQWEDIICLRYSTPWLVQCPICLEHPLCPQITSCGHIFCFPCILQYLLMDLDSHNIECFKRCPLCFVMVSPKDLYTLYIEKVEQFSIGDTLEFALLTRQKGSFTLSQRNEQEVGSLSNTGDKVYNPFSKFAFTSDVDMSVREAISELDNWVVKANSGMVDDLEKLPYVSIAIEQLERRKNFWIERRTFESSGSSKKSDQLISSCAAKDNALLSGDVMHFGSSDCSIEYQGALSPEKSDEEASLCKNADEHRSEGNRAMVSPPSCEGNKGSLKYATSHGTAKDKELYNFYQAVDGQHIILHPLNMKCLLHHYGSYDLLPPRLSGRILELETVTQSEAMRKRYRYLSHFSLTTTFQLCEIDLCETLHPDSLAPFMDEIKKRAKQRKLRARKERREQIKAEVAAAAEYVPSTTGLGQLSHNFSPPFTMDDFAALVSSAKISTSPQNVEGRISFSNVTRLGYAASYDSPVLKIEDMSRVTRNGKTESSTGPGSSSTPSFANVISRAQASESSEAPKGNEVGKKGKKPARVLLSTSGGRRY